jgi:hypothetical protein
MPALIVCGKTSPPAMVPEEGNSNTACFFSGLSGRKQATRYAGGLLAFSGRQ